MANLKNPGLGNSGSFGILALVLVTRIAVIVFCAWNASLYWQILMSFFAPEGFFKLLIGFVALVLWALLQVLEALPLLVKGSLGALALLIKAAERFRGLEVSKQDNPLVASLKSQYNAYPQRWVGRIMLLCYGAFCTDLCILLRYFHPFTVGFTGLTIQWGDLLWLVICLSTVQVTIFLWLLAEGGRAIFKPELQPTSGGGSGKATSKSKEPTKSAAPKDAPQAAQPSAHGGDRPIADLAEKFRGKAQRSAEQLAQMLREDAPAHTVETVPDIPPEIGSMASEYLLTLQIAAKAGEPGALQQYKEAIAYCQQQAQVNQRMASDLRADGTDVNYRPDGGIEFKL